jgi:hypothetical protein
MGALLEHAKIRLQISEGPSIGAFSRFEQLDISDPRE